MDGLPRSTSARRTRARVIRAALVPGVALTGLLALPGTASAAGEVTPVVDCVKRVPGDADWVAVLGYTNTSRQTVTYPLGANNRMVPTIHDGDQPTTFQPGAVKGAFTLTLNANETATWTVSGKSVTITRDGPACPTSTELPADGNGAGPVIGLAAAGLVGGVMVHRANRRARALAEASRGDA